MTNANAPAIMVAGHHTGTASCSSQVHKEIIMKTLKATVRNGGLLLNQPLDLPDGTAVLIQLLGSTEPFNTDTEEGWDNSPEGIAAWVRWCDALEPVKITQQEESDADNWLKKINNYGFAKLDKGIEDVFQ